MATLAVGLSAVVGVPPAGAADFNTRAASLLVTGPGVRLERTAFNLNSGNERCPNTNEIPSTVPASSQQAFCYQARGFIGAGTHDTEFTFRYNIMVPGQGDSWSKSGYAAEGHVLVVDFGAKNVLQCAVLKVDKAMPSRHFSCDTSTARSLDTSRDPEPHWTVTGTAVPVGAPTVYFLGDSVTAGFGYCGTEGGPDSGDINCGVNQPFANAWIGTNSLQACKPPEKANDRCSNNNVRGEPWDTGPWAPGPSAPKVAYSYVIAQEQSSQDPALIENWAVTGSTPSEWDPMTGGRFGGQLKKIKDSYVVMTLGANPLLSDYVKISVAGITIQSGPCAEGTVYGHPAPFYYAQSLDRGLYGVLNCFDQRWNQVNQAKHLLDVYQTLLNNGNHVLVLGYPLVCPWSFGNWQPNANLFDGPATGKSCKSLSYLTAPSGTTVQVQTTVTQWEQATAIARYANDAIAAAVRQAGQDAKKSGDIAFALPSGDWANHQAWDSDSWVFKNDTWIHPSVEGHKQLAKTVVTAMCQDFKHWCGSPPRWKSP